MQVLSHLASEIAEKPRVCAGLVKKICQHVLSSYVPIGTRVYIGFWPWVGPGGGDHIYLHRFILTYM